VSAAPTRSLRATRRPEPSPPAAHSSVDRSFALRTACLTSGSAVVSGVVLEWVGHRHRHGTRRTSGRPACGVTSPHRLTVELPAFAIPRVRHRQPESQSQVGDLTHKSQSVLLPVEGGTLIPRDFAAFVGFSARGNHLRLPDVAVVQQLDQ